MAIDKIQFIINNTMHQKEYSSRLACGMGRCGLKDVRILNSFDSAHQPDLAVFWAHKKREVIKYQKLHNKDYLVMERAYVGDRHHWVSLGYNGLNGRADFCNKDITDPARWNRHFAHEVKPWTVNENGYALVIGQVPGDAAHKHIDITQWYMDTISALNVKNIPVVFRQHPLDKIKFDPEQFKSWDFIVDKNQLLQDSLKGARTCITFSSNSAVISTLAGVPTIAMDEGSMAYNVASNNLDDLDYTPDRKDWCTKLAYCQWLPHELSDGTAWKHLKQKFD